MLNLVNADNDLMGYLSFGGDGSTPTTGSGSNGIAGWGDGVSGNERNEGNVVVN